MIYISYYRFCVFMFFLLQCMTYVSYMVVVAQLVRAPLCGRGGRGFKSLLPPHSCVLFKSYIRLNGLFSSTYSLFDMWKQDGWIIV